MKKRVLVCITGASGTIYGVRLLRQLKKEGHDVHLVISKWGAKTLEYEMNLSPSDLAKEVDQVYDNEDLSASPASGSFHLDAMAVIPCSMKSLASIAHGYASELIPRAADCTLKERRPLILVPREAPLNLIHIRNMELVTQAGAVVIPASPAFWHKPKTIEELVDSVVDRVMTHLHVKKESSIKWTGD